MKTKRLFFAFLLFFSAVGIQASYAADGVQEVQTDAANAQKQALQQRGSTPNPAASPTSTAKNKSASQGVASSTNYQRGRDWRVKTVQVCVKGSITLQLKRAMNCPRGFVKK
ncbi:MAG: hypothetical protein WCJ89_03830 [Actinomycetes bacterium]